MVTRMPCTIRPPHRIRNIIRHCAKHKAHRKHLRHRQTGAIVATKRSFLDTYPRFGDRWNLSNGRSYADIPRGFPKHARYVPSREPRDPSRTTLKTHFGMPNREPCRVRARNAQHEDVDHVAPARQVKKIEKKNQNHFADARALRCAALLSLSLSPRSSTARSRRATKTRIAIVRVVRSVAGSSRVAGIVSDLGTPPSAFPRWGPKPTRASVSLCFVRLGHTPRFFRTWRPWSFRRSAPCRPSRCRPGCQART